MCAIPPAFSGALARHSQTFPALFMRLPGRFWLARRMEWAGLVWRFCGSDAFDAANLAVCIGFLPHQIGL
jgi:hypothetical protein